MTEKDMRIATLEQALLDIKHKLSAHINPATSEIERGASPETVEEVLNIIREVL